MIKKCKVISYNPYLNILVFEFDGQLIQTTATINQGESIVYMKCENGLYTLSTKEAYDESNLPVIKEEIKEPISAIPEETVAVINKQPSQNYKRTNKKKH